MHARTALEVAHGAHRLAADAAVGPIGVES
jgi:hypothetical protein